MQRDIQNLSLLKEGIEAATAGRKDDARRILADYVGLCPQEHLGWLWLGSVASSAADSIASWRRVVELDPQNKQARTGLGKLLLHEGVQAANQKEREKARELLLESSGFDESNELVWLWLATVASDRGEASRYALKALEINPDSERARSWLDKLRQVPRVPVMGLVEGKISESNLNVTKTACPYCGSATEDFKCRDCGAVLTLESAEALLTELGRKTDVINDALQAILSTRSDDADPFDSIYKLALGYLNCGDFDRGALFLSEASLLHAEDVDLNRQIDRVLQLISQNPRPERGERVAAEVRQCSILLVDDSATLRKMIAAGLSTAGHEVRCAVHGKDALKQMASFAPDLVISDINMPHLDGYGLCRSIRHNPVTSCVPFIMLSSRDGQFDSQRGISAGATDFIAKPFEISSLLNLVNHYFHPQAAAGVAG